MVTVATVVISVAEGLLLILSMREAFVHQHEIVFVTSSLFDVV